MIYPSHISLSPWINHHGWLGVKHQLFISHKHKSLFRSAVTVMVDCELKFNDLTLSLSYTSVNRARSHATHSQVKFFLIHRQCPRSDPSSALRGPPPAPLAWSKGSHSRLTASEVYDAWLRCWLMSSWRYILTGNTGCCTIFTTPFYDKRSYDTRKSNSSNNLLCLKLHITISARCLKLHFVIITSRLKVHFTTGLLCKILYFIINIRCLRSHSP